MTLQWILNFFGTLAALTLAHRFVVGRWPFEYPKAPTLPGFHPPSQEQVDRVVAHHDAQKVTPSASPRWGVQVLPWWLDVLKVASLTVLALSALLIAGVRVVEWNAAREPDISVRTIPPLPKHHREVLDDRCVAVFPSSDDKYPECSVYGPDRDDGSSQVASADGICWDGLIARLHEKLHAEAHDALPKPGAYFRFTPAVGTSDGSQIGGRAP